MGIRSHVRGRIALLATAVLAVAGSGLVATDASAADTPGTRPSAQRQARAAVQAAAAADGLQLVVNERGKLSTSTVGFVSDDSTGSTRPVHKPAGATVRKAYLAYATTGFTRSPLTLPLTLDGQDVPMTGELANGISSYNYFADVTSLVKAKIDAAPAGPVDVTVAEPEPALAEGEILEVIFDDPSVSVDLSVSLLYGALSPTGDSYKVQLAAPISLADPSTKLEMSLGISYSYQAGGSQQYSTVDVDGSRLTTAAGGEDDGLSHNGALLTVGDETDSPADPADPYATPSDPRSDDERYDLRPFVKDGDTSIQVATTNPSLDDNIFFAAFTMNPPVTTIDTGKRFVYVALGDSYSSGEGAAFNLRPSADYLAKGYENGSNYPDTVGPQENTYTPNAIPGGNACHRALLNYAKINRDKLSPGAQVVLVDRTCSGAQIEPGGKPPVVGPTSSPTIDPSSQVQQALDRLKGQGIDPADVDLVTVGMGGNDARFGDIVAECVLPGILTELLQRYPDPPSEISTLVDHVGCPAIDDLLVHSDDAIKALQAKEVHAQQLILGAFPNARVLQVDYPDILPVKDSPAWCGGLRGADIDFARQKIKKIDSAVRDSIGQVSSTNGRLQIVEQEDTFGPNALCPGDPAAMLANGLDKANTDLEVTRLLNLNGNGDATARAKLDALVASYRALKGCIANQLNPFDGSSCDVSKAWDDVKAKANDALTYLNRNQATIFANIVSPPGQTDDSPEVGFDRSRGLFHPNANGFAVQACNVLGTWQGTSSDCVSATAPYAATLNGQTVTNNPVTVVVRELLRLFANGFQPLSPVHLRLFSQPVDIADVTAAADGSVTASFAMPDVPPGVHTLEIQGVGANGVQLTRQVLVRVPGRPTQAYATYLCCFNPEPATIAPDAPQETVEVTLSGIPLGTYYPDEYGGVLVHVPTVDRLRDPSALVLEARSSLTGKVLRELLNPVPTAPSLWATSGTDTAIRIAGGGFQAVGRVHSEGGISISGSGTTLTGGVEYATTLRTAGKGPEIKPAAVKVAAGQGGPPVPDIADYRPGGAVQASGVAYRAIPASACSNGVWTPGPKEKLTGVVYVPCGVSLTGQDTVPATIAAEGPIAVRGSGVVVGPTTAGAPSLITADTSASAVSLKGSGLTVRGTVFAPAGTVSASGSGFVAQCGIVASAIEITGSGGSATLGARCLG